MSVNVLVRIKENTNLMNGKMFPFAYSFFRRKLIIVIIF